jgi:hypothetical protein
MNDLVQYQQLIPLDSTNAQSKQPGDNQQHSPKFSIGDEVVWAKVSAHDYGVVVDRVWTTETVHKVTGWHYLVRLHPNSRSYPFCKEDWAYEKDLEPLAEFNLLEGDSLE